MLSQSYHGVIPTDDSGTSRPVVGPAESPLSIVARFSTITYHKVSH